MIKVPELEENIQLELGPQASLLILILLFRVEIFSNVLHIKNVLIPTYASSSNPKLGTWIFYKCRVVKVILRIYVYVHI